MIGQLPSLRHPMRLNDFRAFIGRMHLRPGCQSSSLSAFIYRTSSQKNCTHVGAPHLYLTQLWVQQDDTPCSLVHEEIASNDVQRQPRQGIRKRMG